MGAYLSEPITVKESFNSSNDRLEYGASSMQGWRISQEDTHNCILNYDKGTTFFAVYDGHGGAEVAQYTAEHFPNFLKDSKLYKENQMSEALQEAFIEFDLTLKREDIQQTLKELAGLDTDEGSDDDEEQEAAKLTEEAFMPLDELLKRYSSDRDATNPKQKNMRKQLKSSNKFQSPMIRSKKSDEDANSSSDITADSKDDVKQKLDDQLVNGHENGESKCSQVPDSSSSSNEAKATETVSTESAACSSSDSGICVSASSTSQDDVAGSGGGGSSAVTSSECGGSSSSAGGSSEAAASSGSSGAQEGEPSSSSGRTKKKRSGVIPAEGEDESSFDEDEEDTEDEEDSDEDGDKKKWWSSGSESEDDSEDDEGPFDDEEEEEDAADDGQIIAGGEEPGYDSGCTAVVSVLRDDQLFIANAGDSRCVLCRAGKAVDLSEDHKPEDDVEKTRITKAGGRITMDGRVNGGLNLSRAIGDHRYKMREDLPPREQMITALPDIKQITLTEDDEFMVLACDGIWNAMSSQDVVTFVRERIQAGVHPLSDICGEMFDLFLAPDTKGDGTGCDNMTCIIVNFKSQSREADSKSMDVVTQSTTPATAATAEAKQAEKPSHSEADGVSADSTENSGNKRKAEDELVDSSERKKKKVPTATLR